MAITSRFRINIDGQGERPIPVPAEDYELSSIKVEGFKKIKKIELPIADLNILVGTNGSGKSSILQAVHLSSSLMRQAYEIRARKTSTVSVGDLDYLPSEEYWRLGHGQNWGNQRNSPSTKVTFKFTNPIDDNEKTAYSILRSARNAGISVKGNFDHGLNTRFRGIGTFFSGFIPGISGIPNQEKKQSKRVVLKACSFGDSNVYLRNALNLLSQDEIGEIESWLSSLMGEVTLNISHREEFDLYIKSEVKINGQTHPIELLGTGYLQLIQIFCYILLFKPQILLIDEPDIHLHPNIQERLSVVLAQIAREKGLKILLSTHSPFIVRGAPLGTNVYWLENGEAISNDRNAVELALGWGAFGKKIIVVSEDTKTDFLKKIISQWPELDQMITVHPGRGCGNLLSPSESAELKETFGDKFQIVVHRDRDSFTDDEVTTLTSQYTESNVHLWMTDYSDLEAYFCQPEVISVISGLSEADAEVHLNATIENAPIEDKSAFDAQRRSHNKEIYNEDGGSPLHDDVWQEFQSRFLKGRKGKKTLSRLAGRIGSTYSKEKCLISNYENELALSLRQLIEGILEE